MARRQRSELGQRLVAACDHAGKTQVEVARLAGLTESQMSDYIRGRYTPGWSAMTRIAWQTGTSLDFLAGFTPLLDPPTRTDDAPRFVHGQPYRVVDGWVYPKEVAQHDHTPTPSPR